MKRQPHHDLGNTLTQLLAGVSTVQLALDGEVERDFHIWSEALQQAHSNPIAGAIAETVAINPLRLSELRAAVDVILTQTTETAANVELSIFAQPVHTFYRSRFSAAETATSRIEVTCKAVPAGALGDDHPKLPSTS